MSFGMSLLTTLTLMCLLTIVLYAGAVVLLYILVKLLEE